MVLIQLSIFTVYSEINKIIQKLQIIKYLNEN